MQYILQYLHLT